MELVNEVEPLPGVGPSPPTPVAEGLLSAVRPFLSEALVSQVGACYQFNVTLPSSAQSIYFLDLSTGALPSTPLPSSHIPPPAPLLPRPSSPHSSILLGSPPRSH